MARKKSSNLIILSIIFLLFILLVLLIVLMNAMKAQVEKTPNISVSTDGSQKKQSTIKQVVEASGSKYIEQSGTISVSVDLVFKYDLFDDDGKSKKDFFYGLAEDIEEILIDKTFYLNDSEKNIKLSAIYDKETKKYTILINNTKDYYKVTDAETFVELKKSSGVQYSTLLVNNSLITLISDNSQYYANTLLADPERETLENGYCSYNDGAVLARLQSGKALNIIFRDGYEEEIAPGVTVDTKLSEIIEKYPNPSFGSLKDKYLGYITEFMYIFFYDDEVSVYFHKNKVNEYFNQYIEDYCTNGNLEQLANNFTNDWTNYFEREDYNAEFNSFKIVFPTRGISIDIQNNDSQGITLYKNYYLTDGIKNLISLDKITYEKNEDLIHITEKNRRERMS